MNKPNARELLKEARGELAKAHDHLMELTAKLPMQYFGLVDGNIIQAEDCLVDKIDAYLAAPSESAMEMVRKIRLGGYALNANDPDDHGPNGDDYHFTLTDSDAAALITAREWAVPRAMLEEYASIFCDSITVRLNRYGFRQKLADEVAAKFGYHAE